ncbi:LamG-like jellyroll fold domain-containing protein [Allonocardiopsis opalescens]|uniref:Calcineurin-like phosphoesterase family protein n=1 Tax=Allonocardiopsis opalescens TaxID=1144618 RepID=A0A2T0Q709_9ACTN|nr:LamG-like jellyroll fold domain-containing protein [Allonocardiopsis opalescens]PRX99626.1 calcineurin-like phosphoesterase family protein [Allonocardiopsis opalescens]
MPESSREPDRPVAGADTAGDAPGAGGLARRHLLMGALAAPAALAVPSIVAAPAQAAAAPRTAPVVPPRSGEFDPESPRFCLAVVPDTQYLFDEDSSDPEPLNATFRYLTEQRGVANVAFMAHLGDITEHGSEHEIGLADQAFTAVDGVLPYSVLAGNHDVPGSTDDQRGDTPYLRAFGPDRFAGRETFGGASPDGYNSYHVFRAAGREWLLLALDWRVSDAGIAWAQGVIDGHSRLPVILTTHDLAHADDDGAASLSGHGQRLWDRLVRRNDQVFLTISGHYWPPGRTVLTNDAGNDVHVHITNYQDRYYGGAAMIRLYQFDLARGVVDVETFAPWFLLREAGERPLLGAEMIELTGDVDRFSVPLDTERRFAGFAPVEEPASRPYRRVVTRDTLAYWRFDSSGLRGAAREGEAVQEGAVARDLSGHGNDLVMRRLHGSAAEVLTRSADHHRYAPAHASLRFDGGQGPDRGAILEAVADAPINSEKFLGGYTFEVFIRLPDPFEGEHAWMGIFSWQGRSGDAGKTTGWSPLEPTCSLNVSPERFLQYVVYPHVQDADPTSWSHALPVGRWFHVAVVNDGRRSIVYVEGSPIARNPTQRSTGVATLGRPFTLGATGFDNAFGQGFYGWLGDVRITGRALEASEFMTAFE